MFKLKHEDDGRMLTVKLDRPPANAFDRESVDTLFGILDEIEADEHVRVILFYAEGRFFSAGADIRSMGEIVGSSDGPERLTELAKAMQDAFGRLEALPVPTVCALSGIATGGGFELALACDIRVAESTALLGLPEARIGLLPGAGGTQRLARIAGSSVARRLILTGELISGARAAELGLLHDVAESGGSLAMAREICRTIATVPKRTQMALKRCLALAPSAAGLAAEIEETLALQRTHETQHLIHEFLRRSRSKQAPVPTAS